MRTLEQRTPTTASRNTRCRSARWRVRTSHLADLPLAVPLDSVKHYEDYIARLHQIPRVFTQTEEVLRAGMKDHLMPVGFLLEKVPAQCQGVIAADPVPAADQEIPRQHLRRRTSSACTQQITDAVNQRGAACLQGIRRLHRAPSMPPTAAPRSPSRRCPAASSAT